MTRENYLIDSIDQLEEIYDKPVGGSILKETSIINDDYRQLIESATFFAIASIGSEGMDCSPRGDEPGFIRILDHETLAIPDRRGNNRLDTIKNIVQDSRVALLLLIPGLNETVRINGNAQLSVEPGLLESFKVDGKAPKCVIVIKLKTMYFQCARALKRSRLWDATTHVDPAAMPTAGGLIKSVVSDFDQASYDSSLQQRQEKTLY